MIKTPLKPIKLLIQKAKTDKLKISASANFFIQQLNEGHNPTNILREIEKHVSPEVRSGAIKKIRLKLYGDSPEKEAET